jgi:hypothetical protein
MGIVADRLGTKRTTRREALQISLVIVGLGLVVTSCSKARALANASMTKRLERPARGLFFNAAEMAQLAEIAETIIPTTNTSGARGANVHGFIDNMMAKWAVPKTQAGFRTLLTDIDSTAERRFGSRLVDLSPEQRFDVVSAIDAAAFNHQGANRELARRFVQLKELVLLGYYHSEIGATRELQFKLVPGHYEACAPLSNIGRAWVGDTGELSLFQRLTQS